MIDLYLPRQSWLHATDPRVKLVCIVCALIFLFLTKNLFLMLLILLLLQLLYWSAHISLAKTVKVYKTLVPVGALMAVLWVLFYPSGPPLFQFWMITVTPLSIAQGLVLALRILNIGLVVTLWLYTTDSVSIVQSLVRLGVPYEWGLVLALALRYIPFVQDSYVTISEAQQARGLNLVKTKGFTRARVMLPIFISMMISALRASENVAKALEARGFGGHSVARTSLYDLHATARDYSVLCIILSAFVVYLFLNLYLGFATQAIALF